MTKLSVFQIILLALFGALAAAGIFIFAFAVSGQKATNTVGNVVIWGTLDKPTFDAVLEGLVQANQSLTGISYVQKDAATFDRDLAEAISEKKGPDLYIISSDAALANESRVIAVPFSQVSRAQFENAFAAAADPFLGESGVIAYPFLIDPLVLYWNRDLLSSAGIAQPPAEWNEVPQIAQTITSKDTSGSITTAGIAIGTYDNIEDAKPILSLLIMQSANTKASVPDPITAWNADGKLVSTLGKSSAPAAIDALRFYTEFANPANSDYSWNGSFSSAREAFAQGKVALYVGFASESSLIRAMNPNLNYGMAPVPQLAGSRFLTFGRTWGFAVPLSSENAVGAGTAANVLATASSSAAFASAFGMAPASRMALAAPASSDQTFVGKAALAAWSWSDPDSAQTDRIFRAMIEGTVSGASAPADALSQAGQELQHLLQQ